jgi:DNA-binding response OmpR family regulator
VSEKHVLLVDDEVQLAEIIQMRLEVQGFKVTTVHDGHSALEATRNDRPDIIILDVMLPKLDGYKVCKMLKFDENYKDIPIIMFTALAQDEDLKMGYEIGADAYITKPFEAEVLIDKIQELLKG